MGGGGVSLNTDGSWVVRVIAIQIHVTTGKVVNDKNFFKMCFKGFKSFKKI